MPEIANEGSVYSVSEITRLIKKTLEGRSDFSGVWVRGEIYNFTTHASGHIYFTLKDDNAVISAVFFRSANRGLSFKPRDGMTVLVQGNITVYEKRGSYQLNVTAMQEEGIGELQRRIERLKQKLLAEGLFDPSRRRPLPFLPRRIGIATSPTGAAVRDIIKVALRRYPGIGIVIAPAIVQGDGAVESIVAAIRELNRPEYGIDVIIAGRGGGSFEDLMPFNEEPVVRAFATSRVPIVSAVGHQIDHPLCDDAADMAAPTPSAAAEIAVPLKDELVMEIDYYADRLARSAGSLVEALRKRIDAAVGRRVFREPREITRRKSADLSHIESRVIAGLAARIAHARARLLNIPDMRILARTVIERKKHAFALAVGAIEKLSPLAVLHRGYAIPRDDRGRVIRSINDTAIGSIIALLIRDGTLDCAVNAIIPGGIGGTNGKEKAGG